MVESTQMQEQTPAATGQKVPIPISEPSETHKKIPKVVFIDDAEAWVDKYGEQPLFEQCQELY